MSISNELLTLNTTKQNIKTAINLKGVTVNDEPFADYPDKVRLIPNGGGIYDSVLIMFIEGSLRNVDIPDGATEIGKMAFRNYEELRSVSIPPSVTAIREMAFDLCVNLQYIVIPDNVLDIEDAAFQRCYNLEYVICDSTVPPTLGLSVFLYTNDCPIYVPDNSVLAYQTAANWMNYSARITGISNFN